ncbi:HD-domain/PDEase-like protein [Rhizopogon salebrosus TDB-379]|nr:HD-domain/PDEase-like protein [Rhizopogon salebrosus TDB-379]
MTEDSIPDKRIFKDPVHDYVEYDPWICSFIDTPHFQRLRYVKQLGISYYVFPGASHNRFEHCLGVGHLARMMAQHLQKSQPSLGIKDEHIRCVELAGLCHDLGHGPWSHVWDGHFIPKALPNHPQWTHEKASEMMFDDMVKEYRLKITPEDVENVKALISGKKERCKLGKTMPFLFEIVANDRNGIDVDKFDYIARDCHAVGERRNISMTRLIHSARVIDGQICYDIKNANTVYELFFSRFSLHKDIYNHKTTRAIEYMLVDVLLIAQKHMKFADYIDIPRKYLHLTDDLLNRIDMTESKELAPARKIIHRIQTRDLYRRIDHKIIDWDLKGVYQAHITPESIVHAARTADLPGIEQDLVSELTADHIIVDVSKMHHGRGVDNPVSQVMFYSKRYPNVCQRAEKEDVSLLMPEKFGEILIQVYTKEERFMGLVQAAYRHVFTSVPIPDAQSETATIVATPPGTEAPSTPRPLARTPLGVPSAQPSGSFRRTPSWFATLPPDCQSRSPSTMASRSLKRSREASVELDIDHSPPKRKSLRLAAAGTTK